MNWYCLDCSSVWCAMGYSPDQCTDCGSMDIASQSELTERYVRECVLPLPTALVTLIGEDDKPMVRWLCEKLSGHLDYQDMILNGPLSREDVRSCTCHPDDNPPRPCPQKYALQDCKAAAAKSSGDSA